MAVLCGSDEMEAALRLRPPLLNASASEIATYRSELSESVR